MAGEFEIGDRVWHRFNDKMVTTGRVSNVRLHPSGARIIDVEVTHATDYLGRPKEPGYTLVTDGVGLEHVD